MRVLCLLLFSACATEEDAALRADDVLQLEPGQVAPPPSMPQLYTTCGDPVCSGWDYKGVARCPDIAEEGLACPPAAVGRSCDPGDGCNALITCAVDDPKAGGCPISLRAAKKNIVYLDPHQIERLSDDLLNYRLASWQYLDESDDAKGHVGFIIDDVGDAPSVAPDGGHVDLYGYTSMAVAALQAQAAQIEDLERELERLRHEVDSLAASECPP